MQWESCSSLETDMTRLVLTLSVCVVNTHNNIQQYLCSSDITVSVTNLASFRACKKLTIGLSSYVIMFPSYLYLCCLLFLPPFPLPHC